MGIGSVAMVIGRATRQCTSRDLGSVPEIWKRRKGIVKGKPINKSIRVLQPFSTSPVLPITTTLHPSLCLENSKKYIANSKINLANSKIESNFNFSEFLPSVFRVAAPLVALLF